MKMFKLYFIAFLMVLLVSWVSSEDAVGIDPNSEDSSDTLVAFSEALENYSGLGTNPPSYKITDIVCNEAPTFLLTDCIVNPQGNIVWDFREDLYLRHMMQSVEKGADNTTTIDGCLQYNADNLSDYLNCMKMVREKMIAYLNANFEKNFRSKLQENCSLAVENCCSTSFSSSS